MKSTLTGLAAIAVVALALTGCSAGGPSGGGTAKLEVQTNLSATDPILTVLKKETAEYTASHSGVKIDLVPSTNTYEADMKARMASGDLPDIWATHGWSLLRYSQFLEPLNEQPWAKNFNPALAPAMKNDKGQFFAMPFDTDVAGIVYNEDVLKKAGVDPTSLKTWDDFNAALKKVAATGAVPISSSGKDNWFAGNIPDFMASGSLSDSTLKKFGAGKFQKDAYATILDEVAKWQKAGYFNPDYSSATTDDLAKSLAQGKTGFVMVQNYIVGSTLALNPDAKIGYLPIPSFDGKPFLVGGEGRAFGVARDSAHKQEALDYLAFLAQPENLSKMASAIGGIPGLTNATSDLGKLQPSYDAFVADGKYPLKPYFDRVYLPNGMWDSMVSTTDAVITGQSTVGTAVDQMVQAFDGLKGQSE